MGEIQPMKNNPPLPIKNPYSEFDFNERVESLNLWQRLLCFYVLHVISICIISWDVLKRFVKQFSTRFGKLFESSSFVIHKLLISLCNRPLFLLSRPRQMHYRTGMGNLRPTDCMRPASNSCAAHKAPRGKKLIDMDEILCVPLLELWEWPCNKNHNSP